MTAYCDEEFYKGEYRGTTIPNNKIPESLMRAGFSLDRATHSGIKNIDDWPEFSQRQIKMAVCAQADHEYQFGELESITSALGGYSIGDVSVSGKSQGGAERVLEQHYQLSKAAIRYLMPTGLLDRRLR